MKHLLIIFLFVFLLPAFSGNAQTYDRCGTQLYIEQLAKNNPDAYQQIQQMELELSNSSKLKSFSRTSSTGDAVITIPVVVHVIHNNLSGTIGGLGNRNISDAQILSQIEVLNEDYRRLNADTVNTPLSYVSLAADIKFEFCMATTDPDGNSTNGITRTYSSKAVYSNSTSDDVQLKALSYWPSNEYLNIWVCDIASPILGYAYLPAAPIPGGSATDVNATIDGVVIDYKAFGTMGTVATAYNKGRTATHEIGHWFGLKHLWGEGASSCSSPGTDYCGDTPVCLSSFESTFPACNKPMECTEPRMIENFMDYSQDGCMNLFTEDQKTRMRSVLELNARRNALLSSLGCCYIANLLPAPLLKDFEDGDLFSNGWDTLNPNINSIYTKGFELSNYSGYGTGMNSVSVTNDSLYVSSDSSTHKYYFSYVSPFISLKNTLNPQLRFDWAYSPKTTNGATDSIVVSYASGCATNWTDLYTFYGNDFSSTTNVRTLFAPMPDEWKTTSIDISPLKTKPALRIKYTAYSKGINTFYLDNINIDNSSPDLLVKVYPNPFEEETNIETIFNGKKTIRYSIYNSIGQSVFTTEEADTYTITKPLNLSFLAGGMYLLKVSDGDQTVVVRFIKL